MKSTASVEKVMATGQEVCITIETSDPPSHHSLNSPLTENDRRHSSIGFLPSRMHSRSASWSFTGTARPSASDLSSGLASINPIRSVIREFVPSLNPQIENPPSPPSRSNSQLSLGRLSGTTEDPSSRLGLSQLSYNSPSTMTREGSGQSLGSDNAREQPYADVGSINIQATGNGNAEENGEVSDWARWVEQNIVFLMILSIRYAWIHGLGEL